MEYVNKHEFRIIAMRRSGHHAIINWLMHHFVGPTCFMNECSIKDGRFVQKRHSQYRNMTPEQEAAEDSGQLVEKECHIFNLEDFDLKNFSEFPFHLAQRGKSRKVWNVVIVRDPFNWIASRLEGQRFSVNQNDIAAWKRHVKECMGLTHFVTPEFVPINFNRWFADASYRRHIIGIFELPFTDKGFREVPRPGESSFDNHESSNMGQPMPVLERWMQYKNDNKFVQIFEDEELRELSANYFGFNPQGGDC